MHVQTATHDLIFDTGPTFNVAADSGNRILVPYLRAAGVQRLDTLIVSHADQDHAGGAVSLLAALPVADFITSIPPAHPILQKSVLAGRQCGDGESWEWDGVRFRLLHPLADDYTRKLPTNAMSCVLKIDSPHGTVLIPGDLEGAAEAALLARHGADVRADYSGCTAPRRQTHFHAGFRDGRRRARGDLSGRLSQPLRPSVPEVLERYLSPAARTSIAPIRPGLSPSDLMRWVCIISA